MADICFYLSAAMLGGGLGTSSAAFGPVFQCSAAILICAALGFHNLPGD